MMKTSRRLALAIALSLPIIPLAVSAQQPAPTGAGAAPTDSSAANAQSAPSASSAAPAATPAPAQAEPTKEAKEEAVQRQKRGLGLFEEGDYRAALVEFKRAYELDPNYKILYNIGNIHFQLLDYANALNAFDKYLSDGASAIPATRRAEVEKDIEKLRTRVARIEITTPGVADADVLIDDLPFGKTPFAKPVLVNPGRHRISATKEGRTAASKTIEVASFDSVNVTLDMPEIKAKPVETNVPPPPTGSNTNTPPPPPPPKSIPWAGWGITGAAALGAVVTGSLALSKNSELADLRKPTSGATKKDLEDTASSTATMALVSDVFTGAAVVAGVVTLYFTVRDPGPAQKDTADKTAVIKSLNMGVSPTGITLKGSF